MYCHFRRFHGALAGLLAACLACCIPHDVSAAPATATQAIGGPAGTQFHYQCPSGEFLVGITAKAGQWVDRVGAVCAPWDPVRRATVGYHDAREQFGGTGGQWTRFGCPPNSAISGLLVQASRGENPLVVGNIAQEECRLLEPPFTQVVANNQFIGHTQEAPGFFSSAPFLARPGWLRCQPGQLANGIWGRAGQYVNAVGLFCATPVETPVATASPAAAAPPPTHRGPLGPRSALAIANDDVDVYDDQPDRNRKAKVVAVMRKGQSHRLVEQIGGWSDLANAAGPQQNGWVATDHLTIKQP